MAKEQNTVPVKYLNVGAPGSENLDTSGGLNVEMCTECFALAPTDMIQEHIDSHRKQRQSSGGGGTPDQGLPPESGAPDQGLPPESGAPDQAPPESPPEVSGGTPPQTGQQPA